MKPDLQGLTTTLRSLSSPPEQETMKNHYLYSSDIQNKAASDHHNLFRSGDLDVPVF